MVGGDWPRGRAWPLRGSESGSSRGSSTSSSSTSSRGLHFGDQTAAAATTRGRGGPLRPRARHRSIERSPSGCFQAGVGKRERNKRKRAGKKKSAKREIPFRAADARGNLSFFFSPCHRFLQAEASRNQSSNSGSRRSNRGIGGWRLEIGLAREPEPPDSARTMSDREQGQAHAGGEDDDDERIRRPPITAQPPAASLTQAGRFLVLDREERVADGEPERCSRLPGRRLALRLRPTSRASETFSDRRSRRQKKRRGDGRSFFPFSLSLFFLPSLSLSLRPTHFAPFTRPPFPLITHTHTPKPRRQAPSQEGVESAE